MAESTTIARPYAQAAFEYALAQKALVPWSRMLSFAAALVNDNQLQALLAGPTLTHEQKAQLMLSVAADQFDQFGVNFIKLLAENERLLILPEISTLYEAHKAQNEQRIEVEVSTAAPIDDSQRESIKSALGAKFGKEVGLSFSIDPSLLGGAVFKAGDLVIDGSIKSKLAQLSTTIGANITT